MVSQDFLCKFGFNQRLSAAHAAGDHAHAALGRVCRVDRGGVLVITPDGFKRGTLVGRLLLDEIALAVGDWVAWVPMSDEEVVILDLLPRFGVLKRAASGTTSKTQILVSGVQIAFIACALDADFNLSRVERYLAMVRQGDIEPVLLLTKADQLADAERYHRELAAIAGDVPIHVVSALAGYGVNEVRAYVRDGRTAVVLGSSGVGKSTLINAMLGGDRQKTGAVRASDQRGKHTTTARVLMSLPGGGLIIDTPGLRALTPLVDEDTLKHTFEDIGALAEACRFRDCNHEHDPGCALASAVADGVLDQRRLDNFLKLRKEAAFALERADERYKWQSRREGKRMSRMIREAKSFKKRRG